MTYCLYRGTWYETDPDDPVTVEPLLSAMLQEGDLTPIFVLIAEERYWDLRGLALSMLNDGAEAVYDDIVREVYKRCSGSPDLFELYVIPRVEATQEEEPQ